MSQSLGHLAGQIAVNPKKALAILTAIAEAAPVLIPVAAVAGMGYGIYKLITVEKEKNKYNKVGA